jgi:hypothetical protein
MPPDSKRCRPHKESGTQDAANVGTSIAADTAKPRRCRALIRGHLTGCGNVPEPGSDRCAVHRQSKVQADGPAA